MPLIYSTFFPDNPQFLSSSVLRDNIFSGIISPTFSLNLDQTVDAALTDICWPIIERISV